MQYIEPEGNELPILELSERNLLGLIAKLSDPNSARTLIDPDHKIAVRAVSDAEHYTHRPPGPMFTHGREH